MKNADVRFGPFTLTTSERLLLREGEPVRIGSRALDILIALVSGAGEVITKEELISTVWPRTFVEETNLRVNVAALRKVLGDLQEPHRFISNVTGRGYCFVAPVGAATEAPRHIQVDISKARQALPATGSKRNSEEVVWRGSFHFGSTSSPPGCSRSFRLWCEYGIDPGHREWLSPRLGTVTCLRRKARAGHWKIVRRLSPPRSKLQRQAVRLCLAAVSATSRAL